MNGLQLHFARPELFFAMSIFVLVLLIFFLRRRFKMVPVSTLMFWADEAETNSARKLTRWLIRFFDLLLWFLIISAGVLAAAGPNVTETRQPCRWILVVDNSPSMSAAREDGKTRLRCVKREIIMLMNNIHPNDTVDLIVSAPKALHLADELETNKGKIQNLEISYSQNNLLEAVDLAMTLRRFSDFKQNKIIVYTDASDLPPDWEVKKNVQLVQCRERLDNVGFSDFSLYRDPFFKHTLYKAKCENFSDKATRLILRVKIGDMLLEESEMDILAGETLVLEGKIPFDKSGNFSLVLYDPKNKQQWTDAIKEDNALHAYLPTWVAPKIILVREQNVPSTAFFLSLANALKELVALDEIRVATPDEFERLKKSLDKHDIVVFIACSPLKKVEKGRVIFFDSHDGTLPFEVLEESEISAVTTPNPHHPLLRYVDWSSLNAARFRPAKVPKNAIVLLESSKQVIAFVAEKNNSLHYIYFGLPPDKSNIALINAFPVFFGNALFYFSQRLQTLLDPFYPIGAIAQTTPLKNMPAGLDLVFEEQNTVPVQREESFWRVGPFSTCGKYTPVLRGVPYAPVFVNFLLPSESKINPSKMVDDKLAGLPQFIPPQKSKNQPPVLANRPYGLYFGIVMLIGLLLEWGFFHLRRNSW